jgi:hypothetical protein
MFRREIFEYLSTESVFDKHFDSLSTAALLFIYLNPFARRFLFHFRQQVNYFSVENISCQRVLGELFGVSKLVIRPSSCRMSILLYYSSHARLLDLLYVDL